EVVAPSVMTSYRDFKVGDGKIYYAMAAIKGVGDAAAQHIVEKRAEAPFASLEDFCGRIDPRMVGKRVLESQNSAGALDCFGRDRAAMMAGIDLLMGVGARAQKNADQGITDLFGGGYADRSEQIRLPAVPPWLPAERLQREFLAVGFYLSAHPLDEYAHLLEKMRVQNWNEFEAAVKRGASAGRLAGTVTSKQERKTRTGNRMGVVQFSDTTGQFEAVLFSEALAQYRELLEPGNSL